MAELVIAGSYGQYLAYLAETGESPRDAIYVTDEQHLHGHLNAKVVYFGTWRDNPVADSPYLRLIMDERDQDELHARYKVIRLYLDAYTGGDIRHSLLRKGSWPQHLWDSLLYRLWQCLEHRFRMTSVEITSRYLDAEAQRLALERAIPINGILHHITIEPIPKRNETP